MFVLGTAGHVDHGKSALVKALTGIDPDRLREEKERGMTIDLGFAWLKLPGGREVGVIDVPGHERLIKNMLAGVGGIDLALLIVAANESVMPQTREHLAILDLLEVSRGIAVITKKDLVDDEWLSLVKMEVEELLAPTSLAKAPVVAVSALTGDGLPELLKAIDSLLDTAAPKRDIGRPRLPIDRVFTLTGSGTIVTGTLIDGSLHVGQEVEVVPRGVKSRLRGLQTHKTHIETAQPGSRVAANLVGVNTTEIERGDVVTTPGWLVPTRLVSVKLRVLPGLKRPLRHNAEVTVHTGAAESVANVRLLDREELKPGEAGWAQLALDRPLAVVSGDHFIIRSPMETLGGGKVLEDHAKRYRRFRPATIESLKAREHGTPEDVIVALLEIGQPLDLKSLVARGTLPEKEVLAALKMLAQQGRTVEVGAGPSRLTFTAPGWRQVGEKATAFLKEYHRAFPTRPGMPKGELHSKLELTKNAAVFARLVSDGVLVEEGVTVRLPEHKVLLTPAQQKQVDAFLAALAKDPYSPPTDNLPGPDLLNLLVEQRKVVKMGGGVVFAAPAYDDMVAKVTAHIKAHGKVTLGEVRDMFQTSRKYAQALLEHTDEKKITRRVGDERVMG